MPIFIFLTVIWFLVILSFLVLIHEGGHFLVAKLQGMHVEEFGLGYPPRVKILFTKWNTIFSLNALPIGGFVKLYGDDAEQLDDKSQTLAQAMEAAKNIGQKGFSDFPQWRRLLVVLAGIVVNFIFGVVAFTAIYSRTGIPERAGDVIISEVQADSPAAQAGLQVGDEMKSVESSKQGKAEIRTTDEFINLVNTNRGQEIKLGIVRNSEDQTLTLTPRTTENTPEGQGAVGVALDTNVKYVFYPWWQMPFRGAYIGLQDALSLSGLILHALGGIAVQVRHGEVPQELSGPVGIVGQAVELQAINQGFYGALNWAAILSINLAIMNLLPIPALDGGRSLFIILETFIGKARRLKWERVVNTYAFFILIGLVILISIKDIVQLVK